MRIEKTKCDQCDTEVEDHYNYKGWITLQASRLCVQAGRRKGVSAKSKVYKNFGPNNEFDFCCEDCLFTFFQGLLTD